MAKTNKQSAKMFAYCAIFLLFFSLSISFANADIAGTCKNPSGGDYCGKKSAVSNCYCDNYCVTAKDCCTDYKDVCSSGSKPVCGNNICEEGEADYSYCPPCVYYKDNPCKAPCEFKSGTCQKDCTNKCTDSDGGVDYNTKGTVYYGLENATDFCWNYGDSYGPCEGKNGCVLAEHYCNKDGTVGKLTYDCPNGCKNGACDYVDTPKCTDSDGGKDEFVAGKTYTTDGDSHYDVCYGQSSVVEYYCYYGNIEKETISCPASCNGNTCSSSVCVNGACVNSSSPPKPATTKKDVMEWIASNCNDNA